MHHSEFCWKFGKQLGVAQSHRSLRLGGERLSLQKRWRFLGGESWRPLRLGEMRFGEQRLGEHSPLGDMAPVEYDLLLEPPHASSF